MLSDATSGLKVAAGFTRSSADMVGAPPVVMFTTTGERCLMTLRKGANASGDWSGRPSLGLRACRWTTAAPASAAPNAASAISCAVTGRCGDIDGVWIAPVTAQVMITLLLVFLGLWATARSLTVRPILSNRRPGPKAPSHGMPRCRRLLLGLPKPDRGA